MIKMDFATFLTIAAVYTAMKYYRGEDLHLNSWMDYAAIGVFILFMFWLLRERRQADGSGDGENPRQSLAFRLGKSLNGVVRRFRGGT